MANVIPVYKALGLTPYQTILEFKKEHPEYKDEKVSYAGRLDPMAEGLLLLLVGAENKKRKEYEKLKKTYKFTILFGIGTDSYDLLGKIVAGQYEKPTKYDKLKIENMFKAYEGRQLQAFPPYSSKAVNGKPLYWWARNNRIHEIELPKKEIDIFKLQLISIEELKVKDLRSKVQNGLNKVRGDFRQEEILKSWESFFRTTRLVSFPLIHCAITCSSGTYIRGIAHKIGQELGISSLAYSIKRTHIGEYDISYIINT